ncbi:interferon-inducible double-stranded RNA-dependent protein kinase activator A-like [Pogonomyrmex barbatus]|uniref:Interferon-inducible double-stranded RNA-dependent protein kinase activator A-like n=1 Tax=Pogonomyrmex barbatus TaxID=144034 RepID=A0A6I9W3U9_9HYME|nr:interferon-inducible double-stranded RNA-dependent protein kinase activator A-like [Pogonomyrmex barbatus]
MSKSVINVLQELSLKQGFIPIYNFTEKKSNENNLQFICNVSCKQFKTFGTGSSKKEAKHNAAENMLSLLDTNNEISLPADFSLEHIISSNLSPVKNTVFTKICETSLSPQSVQSVDCNYVGMLQELFQRLKIPANNIEYQVVSEEGPCHLKTFTIEVSVGSYKERGSAQCKKTAKQKAAKNLLLHFNQNIISPNTTNQIITNLNKDNQKTDSLNETDQNTGNLAVTAQNIDDLNIMKSKNVTNSNITINKITEFNMKSLENAIRELGTGILESVSNQSTLAVAKLSEKAKSFYLEYTNQEYKMDRQDPYVINNFHTLFEKNYSSKISYRMREKMQSIIDKYNDQMDLIREIRQDLEKALQVKIEEVNVKTVDSTKCHIICLRLLSSPRITQFGMGETKLKAESRAMYNLMMSILILLNA